MISPKRTLIVAQRDAEQLSISLKLFVTGKD